MDDIAHNKPEDWDINGKTNVREFIKLLGICRIEIDFKGTGINETGYVR